eukprot:7847436-Lingulodinium_polyedra.AAC.1
MARAARRESPAATREAPGGGAGCERHRDGDCARAAPCRQTPRVAVAVQEPRPSREFCPPPTRGVS